MEQPPEKYDPSVREELDAVDWGKVWPRVYKYAVWRARKYRWLGEQLQPEDLVQEALALAYGIGAKKTYRNWNKEKFPALEDFLISIIKSITSHAAKHDTSFPRESLTHEDGSPRVLKPDPAAHVVPETLKRGSSEQVLSQGEDLQRLLDKVETIIHEDSEDEELQMVFLCLEEGISEPRLISEQTGYDIKVVYNILKRFRRKLKASLR